MGLSSHETFKSRGALTMWRSFNLVLERFHAWCTLFQMYGSLEPEAFCVGKLIFPAIFFVNLWFCSHFEKVRWAMCV